MGRKLLFALAALLSIAMAVLLVTNITPPVEAALQLTEAVRSLEQPVATPEPPPEGSNLVNVNTATVEELQMLPGIGEAIAERIIAEREANGDFIYPADLKKVNGIGNKTLDKIRNKICFQ